MERTKTKRARPTDNTPRLGWITDTPKTDESIRTVPSEAWLADDLREYLKTHPHADDPKAPLFPGRLTMQAAKNLGLDTKDRASLFDWASPIDTDNVALRYLRPALDALKLPRSRWHDLRHSFAVIQLSAGVDFKRVSKWLGHSTLSLTLDTYGDYINAVFFTTRWLGPSNSG